MQFKKIEKDGLECTTSVVRPFGCMELWAGNERAHRSLELAGLEGDVIAIPSGGDEWRGTWPQFFLAATTWHGWVLADCVGHGYVASAVVARHVHHLLHKISRYSRYIGIAGGAE